LQSQITYTESELVFALQQKEENAFTYLYDNYAGALNGVVFAMVKDYTLSEDIVQDAFVKIWNNIANYDAEKGRLFTWMKKLIHNLTLDTIKSKGYKNQHKITSDEFALVNIETPNEVLSKIERTEFQHKLANLESKQKQIIDMCYFQGYTQQEIANELDMPLGSVKTKMRYAIIELRKIFN
jgi:RNA polymerase sigma factor (sigma-70 family)